MGTGIKKFGAAFVVGALYLSSHSLVAHGETALDGIAAMTLAATPMVVSAIQAGAQKSIAQTNANTSIYLSTLAAQNQAMATGASVYTSALNTLTTLRIASMNNQLSLEQSYLSMAYQAWDKHLSYQLKREQMASDNYFKMKELELKGVLQRAELAQAEAQFQAELQQKGLSSGRQQVSAFSTLATQSLQPTYAKPNMGWVDPRQWAVPKSIQYKATALGKAFSQVSSLAAGSFPGSKKRAGDITRFLATTSSRSSLPLHQSSRGVRVGDSTHNSGDLRVFSQP